MPENQHEFWASWELDTIWKSMIKSGRAPQEIMEVEYELQRAAQKVMDLEDKLRAWAKTQM